MMRSKKVLVVAALLLAASGCSDTPNPNSAAEEAAQRRRAAAAAAARERALAGPAGLPSVVVAELADEHRVIHFARNGKSGLLVARSQGQFVSGPVRISDAGDAVPGEQPIMHAIAEAPGVEGFAVLQPHRSGFLFSWSGPEGIMAVELDAAGKAVGEPRRVGVPKGAVAWVDIIGDFVLWQEGSSKSRLYLRRWPEGEPILAAEGVAGWHATALADGIAVAWVDGEPGTVRALAIRKTKAAPVELGSGALADVQIASTESGEVVAWTDIRRGEPHVGYAVFRDGAIVRPAANAVPPVGGQALVGLVASGDRKRALLAWEQDLAGARPRRIQLGLVAGDLGASRALATLDFHASEGTPHIVPDGPGFTLLTLAPMVTEGALGHGEEPPVGPVFVRLAADLSLRNAEPIRVAAFPASSGVPASVFGLSCSGDRCTVLAKGDVDPPLVVLATLPVRPSPWQKPVRAIDDIEGARALAINPVAEARARLADLDAVRLYDGRVLVAWVTHVAGEGGAMAPAATLAYRLIDGDKPGPVRTLSEKAISVGGVRLAALPPPSNPRDPIAVVGWAGPSNDTAQVYLSSIGSDGEKIQQKTLTQHRRPNKGVLGAEIFDVDLQATSDGVVVVWSDTRDGNPEIYGARADIRLQRRGTDARLTRSDGPSLEPRLTMTSSGALLAWTDAGDDKADLWVGRLDPIQLTLASPEKLDAGPGHARTPQWAGRALSWIDETAQTGELRLVAMDEAGRATSAIRSVRLPRAQATSATVRCDGERCRGVIAAKRDTLLVLGAFETAREHGAPVTASELGQLSGGTLQDLALSAPSQAVEGVFFFRDDKSGPIAHLSLHWP